jgi:catechol 2,3-dioxygenase-like lactoylglutathione lyase family enzyme
MKINAKLNWKNVGLLLFAGLLAIDVALRLDIKLTAAPWQPIPSARAQAAETASGADKQKRPPIHFPPFPIEEGRARFFHIGLGVADLDASVAFYRDQLGFKVIRYQEFGDIASTAFIWTGDGEPIIELMQAKKNREGIPEVGLTHIGVFIDDVDRIYERTSQAGANWDGEPAPLGPGAPYAGFMRDPDGTRIEIMENPKGGCTTCHRGPHLK